MDTVFCGAAEERHTIHVKAGGGYRHTIDVKAVVVIGTLFVQGIL